VRSPPGNDHHHNGGLREPTARSMRALIHHRQPHLTEAQPHIRHIHQSDGRRADWLTSFSGGRPRRRLDCSQP
jgi:hypothetical protein